MENKVPILRFREFKGEWKKEPLKEYINLISGFAFKGDDIVEDNSGKPLLRGINITEGYIRHSKDIDRFYKGKTDGLEKYFLLKYDIVIGMDGSKVGKNVALVKDNDIGLILIQRVARIRANERTDVNFLFQNIFSKRFQRYVDTVNTSSGIPHISLKQINNFKIGFPTKPEEQTKIATFLTAVDKRIVLLEKKKAELEQYKRGIMQKIFKQEIRFKDKNGKDFPKWEEKRLGEILKYIQPTNYLVSDTEYSNDYSVPVLTAGKTFLLGYTNETEGVFLENLPTIIFDDFTTAFQFVDFPFKAKSSAMKMLIPANKNVHISFVYEAMKTITFPLSEHKRYWISEYQYQKIPFPSIDEQQKIATFLSTIDKKIEKTEQQIESSKKFKQGLLQKMFI